ncbi:MAG: ISKra4 family transposase [Caldilineaceae bacterium]|jgi:hypothetical protein
MDSRILDQLEELCGEELTLVRSDLGQLEQVIGTLLKSMGAGLLQRVVDRGRNGYRGSIIPCSCGGSMRFVGHRPRSVHTLWGWITIHRAYYHCAVCHRGQAPYDQDSGLGAGQLSPALAKACCTLAVDDSFAQSAEKIEQLFGETMADTTVEALVHQVGAVSAQSQDHQRQQFEATRQIPAAEAQPQRLYVSVDGTTAREWDGYHAARVGCIYWEDEQFRRHAYYLGRFCDSQTFGWHLWLAACRWGLRGAKAVIYLGDGAPWIRSEQQRHFQRAVFIIDWYHASEHLWDCGKILFGEGTPLTEQWVQERLSLLWDGQTRKRLEKLKADRHGRRGEKRKTLNDLIRYISTNEEQMRYDVFREKGYDIGSGAVEGACKHVVGKRLKQSGMIWTRPGSSATLALRLTWLNSEWDPFWQNRPMAA